MKGLILIIKRTTYNKLYSVNGEFNDKRMQWQILKYSACKLVR